MATERKGSQIFFVGSRFGVDNDVFKRLSVERSLSLIHNLERQFPCPGPLAHRAVRITIDK